MGYLYVAVAAALWGLLGPVTRVALQDEARAWKSPSGVP